MAGRNTKAAEAKQEDTKTEEPKVEETKQEEPKATEPKADNSMIEVHNPQHLFYVQPSTGIRIGAGETKKLLKDGWLKAQLEKNILKEA